MIKEVVVLQKWSWAFTFTFSSDKMLQGRFRLRILSAALLSLLVIVGWSSAPVAESALGVNWGTVSFHKLKPSTVVDLLQDNKISKVKLFDADPDSLQALMGSGIQVMIGVPNEMLAALSSSTAASDSWVRQNVSRYMRKNGVDIRSLLFSCSFLFCFVFQSFVLLFDVAQK